MCWWRSTSTRVSIRAPVQSETVEIFISNDIQMDPNKCENAFFGLCVLAVHHLHNTGAKHTETFHELAVTLCFLTG